MDTRFPVLRQRSRVWMMGCLVGLTWLGPLRSAHAEGEKTLPTPAASAPAPATLPVTEQRKLTIGDCIALAHERSPILKNLRNKVESAVIGQRGIDKTSRLIHNLISPDLKYRKQQAANGIVAAQVELMQAEHDVTYSIVRTYYSAVYARQQLELTTELVKQFKLYLEFVKSAVEEDIVRTLNRTSVDIFTQYVVEATDKQIESEFGYQRALEGLRHELSVDGNFPLNLADEVIPAVDAEVNLEAAVAHALNRRGEIALARIGVEVLQLETVAQGVVRFRLRQPTAAAASDVHSRVVPSGSRDGEYRPDAISPDFPTLIVGDRAIRSEKAASLTRSQESLAEKVQDLVTLETRVAAVRYEQARRRVAEWKVAADAGAASVDRERKNVNGKPGDEKILTLEGLAARSRATYTEARYQQLLALASLERATAGGIRVNYPGR